MSGWTMLPRLLPPLVIPEGHVETRVEVDRIARCYQLSPSLVMAIEYEVADEARAAGVPIGETVSWPYGPSGGVDVVWPADSYAMVWAAAAAARKALDREIRRAKKSGTAVIAR